MKRIFTSLLSIIFISVLSNAQTNLVTNSGFEEVSTTFTVTEGTTNVLMRVAGIQDATTQIANPTTTATTVTAGMWVKKAANSGYIKGIVTTSDYHSGTSCLNLRIGAGTTQTGLISWYNCINLQKLTSGLSSSKKYIASVWAKVDGTANNHCTQLTFFITDNTLKSNYTKTVDLTGGTTWTQYEVTFDLPTWSITNTGSDFSTAYFGSAITTTYGSDSKTLYSGILLDDFSLTEEDNTATGISDITKNYNCFAKDDNIIVTGLEKNQKVNVYSITGKRVSSQIAGNDNLSVPLSPGIYIVNVDSKITKVIVK